MCNRVQHAALTLLVVLGCMLPTTAQVTIGDETNLSLNGSLAFGYSGAFSNTDGSTHGIDIGGIGNLRGFYYDPRFLSFNFQPYYRRSQDNSIYQSITNDSGFIGTASFFSGSHFPGSVSFSRQYDTAGQFGVPGISGITSHGSGNSFGITWSALVPRFPTLTANYSMGSGSSSVYGTNTESHSSSRAFGLQSTYKLAGFDLQGQYTRLSLDANFPAFLEGGEAQQSTNGSNTLNFTAGHRLPLSGYWSIGWNRSTFGGDYRATTVDGSSNGSVDGVNTALSLNPTRKLGLFFGADYNDNVYGSLQQQILQAGGGFVPLSPELTSSSSAASVYGQASYSIFKSLALYARVIHRELWLPERDRDLTQFSGNATFNFTRRFLGTLTFSVGMIDNATEQGNTGASLIGNANYMRRFHNWEVGSSFGYTQQVQTFADVYTTSLYSYGASVTRRFGDLHWTTTFNGNHSGIAQYEGFSSRNEGFATSLSWRRYNANAQYSQSTGASIVTATGLVPVPAGIPAPLVSEPFLYNGKSYGGGGGVTPLRRLLLTANYAKAYSGTLGPLTSARFGSTIVNTRMQYRLRKLTFDANFTRFQQSVTTGTLPAVVNSYYFRISRWFNVF